MAGITHLYRSFNDDDDDGDGGGGGGDEGELLW